jgi:hypothetical protein
MPNLRAAILEGDSVVTRKEKRRWVAKIGIKIRTIAVFIIALGGTFSLVAIGDLTSQWNGTTVNYELTTAAYAAIFSAVVIAVLYYSATSADAPVATKMEKKVPIL